MLDIHPKSLPMPTVEYCGLDGGEGTAKTYTANSDESVNPHNPKLYQPLCAGILMCKLGASDSDAAGPIAA
jgi:hypothetical protein